MLWRVLLVRRRKPLWILVAIICAFIFFHGLKAPSNKKSFSQTPNTSNALPPVWSTSSTTSVIRTTEPSSSPTKDDFFRSFFVWSRDELKARPAPEHSPVKGSTVQCKTEKKGSDYVVDCPLPKRQNRARMFDFFSLQRRRDNVGDAINNA